MADGKAIKQEPLIVRVPPPRPLLPSAASGAFVPPTVQNSVASFGLSVIDLDLRALANRLWNTEFNPSKKSALVVRLREPPITAQIFMSGRVTISGARTPAAARQGVRLYTMHYPIVVVLGEG